MTKKGLGAAVGICLSLVAMGLVKTSTGMRGEMQTGDIAQVDTKYKDRCPYYPSPVVCSPQTLIGSLFPGHPG